jgi:flagellin
MLNINTNYGAAFAAKAAKNSSASLNTAFERLSSGSRINFAKDDAAGQGIATRLAAEVKGLEMASRNAADAQAMVDTADGAYQEVSNMLLRMREMAVQAVNGTLSSADRTALNTEMTALENEITKIANNTEFAGIDLGTSVAVTFQIGAAKGETITHTFKDFDATKIGATGGVDTATNAANAISLIDDAISLVSTRRGELGALSNRLSSTIANLDNIAVNLSSAKGRIQDTDFATETSNLAKSQIMQQAATAMLAQANASKQTLLALIQ